MSKALINRLPKAHKGHKKNIPTVPLRPNPKMTTKALGTNWTLPVTSLQNWYQKEFQHHKNCRTEKSKKEIKWPTLYSVITCWKSPNRKMPERHMQRNPQIACTVSCVTALRHPQKKQGQGKNSSQTLCQNNNSVPREKGTYSRSYREHEKPEIWKGQRTALLNILWLFLQHLFLTQSQVAGQKNVQQSVNTQVQLCEGTAEGWQPRVWINLFNNNAVKNWKVRGSGRV